MARDEHEDLSAREWLARIGLNEDAPTNLLDDEPLADPRDDLAALLRERYQALQQRHAFAPGDLVTWKPGLKNKHAPGYGQPAVVVEVLTRPLHDRDDEAGSPYFREPLDLVLGVLPDAGPAQGQLLLWHFDSRRFQPWTEEL